MAKCGMYVMKDEEVYKMWYIGTTRIPDQVKFCGVFDSEKCLRQACCLHFQGRKYSMHRICRQTTDLQNSVRSLICITKSLHVRKRGDTGICLLEYPQNRKEKN